MAKQLPWIGEHPWNHGPLALGPEAARKAMAKELAEPDRKNIAKASKKKVAFVPAKLGRHQLFLLPRQEQTRIVPIDKRSVVLVRRACGAHPRDQLPTVMDYQPGWATEPWKPVKDKLVVPKGGLVLFDTVAQHPESPQNAERAQKWLPLGLPPGDYVVEHIAKQKFDSIFAVEMLYIHPADHRPELVSKKTPGAKPTALEISKDIAAAAKKLQFVESEGGPLIVMPERAAKEWWGVFDEDGESIFGTKPTHYDLACKVRGGAGTLKVAGDPALVLPMPDMTAPYPTKDGVVLVRWVGADHAAALLAPALGPGTYKPTKQKLTSAGGTWLLFDSASDGRSLPKKQVARFTLPKGNYSVEVMNEWNGEVTLAGKTSEVMAGAVRLRRVR